MKENLINSDFLEKYKEDVALRDVHKCDKRSNI